jgi:CRP-like cAMP-binding protein
MKLVSAVAMAKTSRWLSRQNPDFQNALAGKMRPVDLARNAKLFHAEDQALHFYFIAEGIVVSLVPHPIVGLMPGEVYHAGEWFGLPAALSHRPRMATIEARQECSLLAVNIDDVMQIAESDKRFVGSVLDLMADNAESLMFHGLDLSIPDLKLRLCSRLLTLAGRKLNYLPEPDIVIPLNQEELALTCNASRQTIHSLLRELESDGLCELGYGRIIIKDTKAMARLLAP